MKCKNILHVVLTAGLALIWSVALGQGNPSGPDLKGTSTPGRSLLSEKLLNLKTRVDYLLGEDPSADPSHLSNEIIKVDKRGRIRVRVKMDELTNDAVERLVTAGLKVEDKNPYRPTVIGLVSHSQLDVLSKVPGVQSVEIPVPGITNTGSVITDGDTIVHSTYPFRELTPVTGAGITVGVISDGIQHWSIAAADGDLPENVISKMTGSGDEGTAMAEIVYDVAPGVELYFARGLDSSEQLVSSITWMRNQGVDIIVDDLSFYGEPYFEDGDVAQAAIDAINDGIVYITSAGNMGYKKHYQADFSSTGTFHDFDPGAGVNEYYTGYAAPFLESVVTLLQWSDKWENSGNDYNLYFYIYDYDDTEPGDWVLLDSSTSVQDGDDKPFEWLVTTLDPSLPRGPSGGRSIAWRIEKASGDVRELELFIYEPTFLLRDDADAIVGQTAVNSVISTGAYFWDWENYNLSSGVEYFSSEGPSTIYTDFASQTSTVRNSLDVMGADGVATRIGQTIYFPSIFYGTSASAPHIAGMVALLLEMYPNLMPGKVQSWLTHHAEDIEEKGIGYDHESGYGVANMWFLRGDADMDGDVDQDDMDIVLENWGETITCDTGWGLGDFNGDSFVGGDDLVWVLTNWGAGVTSPVAPDTNPKDPPVTSGGEGTTGNDWTDFGADVDVPWMTEDCNVVQFTAVKRVLIIPDNPNFVSSHAKTSDGTKVHHYHYEKDYGDSGMPAVADGNRYWDWFYSDDYSDITRISDCTNQTNDVYHAYHEYKSTDTKAAYAVPLSHRSPYTDELHEIYPLGDNDESIAVVGDRCDSNRLVWVIEKVDCCPSLATEISWKTGMSGVYKWTHDCPAGNAAPSPDENSSAMVTTFAIYNKTNRCAE